MRKLVDVKCSDIASPLSRRQSGQRLRQSSLRLRRRKANSLRLADPAGPVIPGRPHSGPVFFTSNAGQGTTAGTLTCRGR
jgi:hypothetical protein